MRFIRLITGSIGRIVRLVLSIVGFLYILVGIIFCFTIVGIIIGVPLIILGLVFVGLGRFLHVKAATIGMKKGQYGSQTFYYDENEMKKAAEKQAKEKSHVRGSGKVIDTTYTKVDEKKE
jgi:hypothetical protein